MKILVVDDSIVFRAAVKRALEEDTTLGIKEIKSVSNGLAAVDKQKLEQYDVIIMDLEMPVMDGIEATAKIRDFDKNTTIIMFSAQNLNAANKTLKALELGADDFVSKLVGMTDIGQNIKLISEELVPRIKSIHENKEKNVEVVERTIDEKVPVNVELFKADLICIGSSTGGPEALKKVFSGLNKSLKKPILIVQHMPPLFTAQLAKMLQDVSGLKVTEVGDKTTIEPGQVYLAAGDLHMELFKIGNSLVLNTNKNEKVCFVRPSYDVLLNSVSDAVQMKIACFCLTGMGEDGRSGIDYLKKNHKDVVVVVQDQKSSIVWGMPGAIVNSKLQDHITSLDGISNLINNMAG